MNNKKGTALVSILALTSLVLAVIASTTVVSVINAKISLGKMEAQKAYNGCSLLADEVILEFARERSYQNLYSSWTNDCLQINGFDCKMESNITQDGGIVDIFGKFKGKQKHLRVNITVDSFKRVSALREEIY